MNMPHNTVCINIKNGAENGIGAGLELCSGDLRQEHNGGVMRGWKRRSPVTRVFMRIVKARIWKGCVRVEGNAYSDSRLGEYEGAHVGIGFDPKSPEFVWVHLDDGHGLMAHRVRDDVRYGRGAGRHDSRNDRHGRNGSV